MADLATRFWSKVDIRGSDECWPWRAGTNNKGYGMFFEGSRTDGTRRMSLAHRVAFRLRNGAEPEENALHRCDHPPCCNPGHLWDGTQLDNVNDMLAKGRGWIPPPTPGEAHGCAKLTEVQVIAIRADPRSQRTIAAEYGMSQSQISDIRRGKSWRHVSGEQAQTAQETAQETQAPPAAT